MVRLYINESVWTRLYEILRGIFGIRVRSGKETRRFIEGISLIAKTREQWRKLPEIYCKWRSIHKR